MRIDKTPEGEFRYGDPKAQDQDSVEFGIMPSQTVGPYVHIGLTLDGAELIAENKDAEDTVKVTVTVLDGAGDPIDDSMVEVWQARPDGTFNSPSDPRVAGESTVEGFRGLGRAFADETGTAVFYTCVPGKVEDVADLEGEAPHLRIGVFARGILERLYTRMYFPEFTAENAADPVLNMVDESRRHLLVADKTDEGYHLTIKVQHEDPSQEMPFFGIVGIED